MAEAKVPSGADLCSQVVGQTALSTVGQEGTGLTYRGYDVRDLATAAIFEGVAYLLLYGELPNKQQLDAYLKKFRGQRDLPQALRETLERVPRDAHPVDVMRTSTSVLGTLGPELSLDQQRDVADRLLATFPAVMTYWYRFTHEGQRIDCNSDEPTVGGHFLALLHSRKPSELRVKVVNVSLVLYAEHEFNASTFTARIYTSTLSDLYSYVTDAIGSPHGLLHGDANKAAMELTERFPSPQEATVELLKMLERKDKITGFGHAIYKDSGPRNGVIKGWSKQLADEVSDKVLFAVSEAIDKTMWEQKKLFPNANFYHASAYHFMGIPTKLFTPVFICSRTSGWTTHVFEQRANNRIIRPSAEYTDVEQCVFVPLEQRWSTPSDAPNASAPDGYRTQNSKGRRGLRHDVNDTLLNTL